MSVVCALLNLLIFFPHLTRVIPLPPQLRVVRAFKSTLEDLEEKRSIHSFHSLHSLRTSRSHQGPRPISEEGTIYNYDKHQRNVTRSTDLPLASRTTIDHKFKTKSHSFENVPLVAKQPSPLMVSSNPDHKTSPSKTFSHSDVKSITETSI